MLRHPPIIATIGVQRQALLTERLRLPNKSRESGIRLDALCASAPGDPLDQPVYGQSRRHLAGLGTRIWQAHKLQPHRLRTFKRSRDPSFAAKLADIVGLYVDPPAHAVAR